MVSFTTSMERFIVASGTEGMRSNAWIKSEKGRMKMSVKDVLMKCWRYSWIVCCLWTLSEAQAVTYYVDSVDGNDAYDGKSQTTPWRSIEKVNAAKYNPGDNILFRRGRVWRDYLRISSPGTTSARITYGAYGSGAKPIINVMESIAGWTASGNWTGVGGGDTVTTVQNVFESYFETGSFSEWSQEVDTGNDLFITSNPKYSGKYAAYFRYDDLTPEYLQKNFDSVMEGSVTVWVLVDVYDTWTNLSSTIIRLLSPTGVEWMNGAIKKVGSEIQFFNRFRIWGDWNMSNWVKLTSDTKWHKIEVQFKIHSTDGYHKIYIDDTLVHSAYGLDTNAVSGQGVGQLQIGPSTSLRSGTSGDLFMDNARVTGTVTTTTGGPKLWYINLNYNPARLLLSGTEYPRARTLNDVNETFRWYYDSTAKRLYVYALSNPASYYSSMEFPGHSSYVVFVPPYDCVTIQNLDLRGGYVAGIMVNGADYLIIENCQAGLYAGRFGIMAMHNAPVTNTCNRGIIRNCVVDSGKKFKMNYYPNYPEDGIKLFNGANYWEVYNNTVSDWGHTGILISTTDTTYTTFYNKIYSNTVTASNVDYCRGISTEGLPGTCRYNEITRNLVRDTTVRNQINGEYNIFAYNIIDTVRNVAYRTNGTGQGISLEGYDGFACNNNGIYNNVILNCDEPGIQVWGYSGTTNKYGNKFINNLVFDCGKHSIQNYAGMGIVIENHSSVQGNTYQNNLVYNPGYTNTVYYRGERIPVSTFNSRNGQYSDAIGSNLAGNPLFVNVNGGDYHLQAGSPCINAGRSVGLSIDYAGTSVPRGSAPEIGAFEY